MYLRENNVCSVILSLYLPRKMKNMPDHDGNRTHDPCNASPMLCQLNYSGQVGSMSQFVVRLSTVNQQNYEQVVFLLVPSFKQLEATFLQFVTSLTEISVC